MIRFKQIRYIAAAFILAGILLVGMGCSKITPQNFEKLNSGMSYEEVCKIIGEPTSCESMVGVKSCAWKDGEKTINVKFLTDKVLLFSSSNL